MKLEIKHLAPYLPYGLKFIFVPKTIEGTNLQREVIAMGSYWVKCGENPLATYHLDEIKPLLLPLSAIDKMPEIINTCDLKKHEGEWCERYYADQCESPVAYVPVGDVSQWQFKHHFDVFGLIPAGLALNKLDYEK